MAGIASSSDLLRNLERRARRRAWLFAAVPAVLFGTLVIMLTIHQPPGPDQFLDYALNIGALFALILTFGVVMQFLAGRGVRRFAASLKARTKEAALARRGPSLMLDNGLLVSSFLSGVFLTLFIGSEGSPLHPRLDEALLWTRPGRLKFVRMVRSRTGPAEVRADLDALVARLGVGYAIATAHEGKTHAGERGGPRWVVSVSLFRLYRGADLTLLASHLDEVETFMRGFIQPALAGAAPQPFPRRNLAVGIAAMAILPVLLAAAFLLPGYTFIILTAGMVFILVVGSYGAYAMRVHPPG